jgi:flagellar motility protein MotE (MotC chaperone)
MKMRYFKNMMICTLLAVTTLVYGQDTTKVVDRTLAGQYKEMLSKSSHFQDHRMVRSTRLANFYKNFTDSLNKEKRDNLTLRNELASQNQQIAILKDSLVQKDTALSNAQQETNSISLLGINLSKGSYNLIMWGLVFILAIAFAVVLFNSSSHRREARHRIERYDEIAEEYKNFKTRANEKEKKLARQLQDEINKVAELTGKHH